MITAWEMNKVAKECNKIRYQDLNVFQKLRVIYESGKMTKRIEKAAREGEFSAEISYEFIYLSKKTRQMLEQIFEEKGFCSLICYDTFRTEWRHPPKNIPPTGGSSQQDK